MLCPFCKEEIQDGAIKCKHCGSMLVSINDNSDKKESINNASHEDRQKGYIAVPIITLILGIFSMLCAISIEKRDNNTFGGFLVFGVPSFVLGIVFTAKQLKGRGMSIAGIVLGSLSIIIVLIKMFIK